MKISIITATYNSSAYITQCIKSVNDQTYPNIEHIIIDGASNDNTVEIIKSSPNRINQIISEPDNGIYDALNKGIKKAKGDIIGFLHADDIFASDNTLTKIVCKIRASGADAVYGNIVIVKKNNHEKVFRRWRSKDLFPTRLDFGWMPAHTSLFIKKVCYNKIGLFDSSFKIAGDYDFILRLFNLPGFSAVYIPEVLVKMQNGGASSKSLKNILQKSREDYKALKKNNFRYPYLILAAKNLRKLTQFIK